MLRFVVCHETFISQCLLKDFEAIRDIPEMFHIPQKPQENISQIAEMPKICCLS